ncbi:MAG: 4-hydroxy-tetrahydrodipicolinate synthase [Planctomycetota bacterium]
MKLHGSIPALVTPFKGGVVDLDGLASLVDFQVEEGSGGIVACGTTGEASTMTLEERAAVVRAVVQRVHGRIPVIAGTGSNDTRATIAQTRAAREWGADAALVVTPYYNKPTQEGLFLHYKAVAEATDLPVILYNVPGRTSVSFTPETVARVAQLPRVVAIKEASGSLDFVTQLRNLSDIPILSGEDSLTFPMIAMGAVGVVSVVANILPKETAALCSKALAGDLTGARAIHQRLFPVIKALFIESNPIPVKTALRLMGRGNGEVRLPLCAMSSENESKLKAALAQLGIL